MLSLGRGAPRFDGALTFRAPPASATPAGRLAQRALAGHRQGQGDAASALFEAVEFQYGPEERALRLTGTAEMKFGDRPRFDGVLAAMPGRSRPRLRRCQSRALPLAAIRTIAETFGALRPPIPVRMGVSIEAMTLAGSTMQSCAETFAAMAKDGISTDSSYARRV